jgi:NAD(P)H-hydrate epimerase
MSMLLFRKPEKEHFKNLIKACEANDIKIMNYQEEERFQKVWVKSLDEYDLVMDAIFGFSFRGPLKSPYDKILPEMKTLKTPIFSIDTPSGWEIEKGIYRNFFETLGNVYDTFTPQHVMSLQSPKICMKGYKGIHYLGGRFIPK